MKFKRIIARLDIKGPNLVKGIHLEGLRVLGKPETYAEYYFNQGIDELIYSDVVASLYERNSILKTIKDTAETISIPMTVGGGIRNLKTIKLYTDSGIDKVILGSAAIKNKLFLKEACENFENKPPGPDSSSSNNPVFLIDSFSASYIVDASLKISKAPPKGFAPAAFAFSFKDSKPAFIFSKIADCFFESPLAAAYSSASFFSSCSFIYNTS